MTKAQLEAMSKSLNDTGDGIIKLMKIDRRYDNPENNAIGLLINALAVATAAAAKVTKDDER